MFTAEGLNDIHGRAHQSLKKLIEHCGRFNEEELSRDIAGFGYPNLKLQLHHAIGAERYWISVLLGRIDVDENESDYASIENLERFRRETYLITEQYISSASEDELNTARPMMTWGNKEKTLMPAQVFMRTLTHIFHHQGQIVAMCRLLGRPIDPGVDYPIT